MVVLPRPLLRPLSWLPLPYLRLWLVPRRREVARNGELVDFVLSRRRRHRTLWLCLRCPGRKLSTTPFTRMIELVMSRLKVNSLRPRLLRHPRLPLQRVVNRRRPKMVVPR